MQALKDVLFEKTYPGRGIFVGKSEDGKKAVVAYFIMGRSENSRNRIFVEDGEGIRTEAFDPAKLSDPSLIIYSPVRVIGNKTIVTNGDQTDTIYKAIEKGSCFNRALQSREFEPDAPNFTPRISAILERKESDFSFKISILKSNDGDPGACNRYLFQYATPMKGEGRFISTYMDDGNPLPSFTGEPMRLSLRGDIDSFTNDVWESLNTENKISLFTRFIDLETGETETRILNKNK